MHLLRSRIRFYLLLCTGAYLQQYPWEEGINPHQWGSYDNAAAWEWGSLGEGLLPTKRIFFDEQADTPCMDVHLLKDEGGQGVLELSFNVTFMPHPQSFDAYDMRASQLLAHLEHGVDWESLPERDRE